LDRAEGARVGAAELKRKQEDRAVGMSDADAEYLRRHGHDPRLIERMEEVHSPGDFRRVKTEVEGGAA